MNSKPTIEHMPDEVMIEVFGFLSLKLLKIAALVCKRWDEIISLSPKTVKHYLLNLKLCPDSMIMEAVSIRRKLTSLKTNILSEPVMEYMRSRILTHLELHKLIISKQRLAEILALVPNATSLVFHKTELEVDSRLIDVEPVKFLKLKWLRISMSDTEILSLIATTALTEISLVRNHEQKGFTVVNFLVQQKFLKSLNMQQPIDAKFVSRLSDFPFKLKNLTVFYDDLIQLEALLFSQKDSLEELKLWSNFGSTFVFSFDMPNLRSLTTPRLCCPQTLPEFGKLEHLSAVIIAENGQQAERFLRLARNFKAFEFEILMCVNYDRFFANIARIESLGLRNNANEFADTVFANLKELTFTCLWTHEETFNRIIRNHSRTLEKLTIVWIDDQKFSRGTTIDAIKTCKKLKLLSVGCSSPLVSNMLRKVKLDHPWTLEVFCRKGYYSNTVRDFVHQSEWLKIVFKFPDDEALFQGKCTTWDDGLLRSFQRNSRVDAGVGDFIKEFK